MGKTTFRDLTTFKTGGEIAYYEQVDSKDSLVKAILLAKGKSLPFFVIGSGSDILVGDDPFLGVVIKITANNISFKEDPKGVLVTAEAGVGWDDLVLYTVEHRWSGIELLSGIPGTCGAAPVQNIGAFGQELKDSLSSVLVYDVLEEKFKTLDNAECHFTYRNSIFKDKDIKQRYIIFSITLLLSPSFTPTISYDTLKEYFSQNKISNPTLLQVREAVLQIRKQRIEDPIKVPNAGSFFKNPMLSKDKIDLLKAEYPDIPCFDNGDGTYKCFAGWFIEKAGWKGKTLGKAKVSDKHALILTNPDGQAGGSEIKKLADAICVDVLKQFGVELEPEVQLFNF